MNTNKLLLIIIAILLPPVAVALARGLGKDFAINLLLCLVFWLPGLIHALWIVSQGADNQAGQHLGN